VPFLKRKGKPSLHYRIDDFTDPWKNAPTVLLQHGFGRSSQFWTSWVPYLSRFYKVVRPDLRGLGLSPVEFNPATDLTIENYIDDMTALLDALGLESVHYCGESFGGILGMVLAATHPARVRTLSLVSAPVSLNQKHQETFAVGFKSREEALRSIGAKKWAAQTNGTTRFPPGTDPGLLEWYANEMGKSDVEVLCGLYGLLRHASAASFLPKIKAPVLGLYPTGGPITSREQEEQLAAGIPQMKFIHVPTAFHSVLTLLPATCAGHVLHFAAAHDGIACREP
jgi:3-oxoadipate enol-lactonase